MFNKEELDELLVRIGSKIERSMKIYMIGGCALSFKGLKETTNDIDIIVTSKDNFNTINKAMEENGFQSISERESEFYLTALAVYKKDDSRIDVFLKQVGKMLLLSNSMVLRAEKYKKYGNLEVYLISNEDIFLFKSMTSREGDIYDCDRIMRTKLDYDVIYNEIAEQSKEIGKKWFFWLYESLCRLENFNGIRTPIKKKVFGLVKSNWMERPDDFMKDVDNMEEHLTEKRLLKDIRK